MANYTNNDGNNGSADIWVTRLRAGGVPFAPTGEAGLLKRALDANHYYRTGQLRYPHPALWGDDVAYSNPYLDGYYAVWPQVLNAGPVDALRAGCNYDWQVAHGNGSSGGGIEVPTAYDNVFQANIFGANSCGGDVAYNPIQLQLFTKHGGLVLSGRFDPVYFTGGYWQQEYWRQDGLLLGASLGSLILADRKFPTEHLNGDLSVQVMQGPPNAMPAVTSFTASKTTVSVGEPVTFTVAVSDPDATACTSPYVNFKHRVEWYMEGWNFGMNNPTYTTDNTVNSTNKQFQYTNTFFTVGTRTVRALVMDEWRAVAWKEITVTVVPPVVTCAVTAPTNGAVVMEGTNLTITAYPEVSYGSVSNVEFYLDGLKIATALSAPYSFVWTNAVKGAHVLTAKATDGVGNVTNSTAVSLSVLPITTCTITAPANGTALLAGTDLTITAAAAVLADTVSKVEFFHDGVLIGEAMSAPYSCVWSNVPFGLYALTARATQSAGRVGDSAAVYVNATASGSWEGVSATGGTVTNYTQGGNNYRAHIFTTVGTNSLTVMGGGYVDVLVVAGGGGGGFGAAGGGGGGGFLSGSTNVSSATYTIVVGIGGTGSTSRSVQGGNGGNSSFANSSSTNLTAIGGGGGGSANAGYQNGKDGGSGGGASNQGATKGNGTTGQGYNGGIGGTGNNSPYPGGGGGGAGGVGQDGSYPGGYAGAGGTGAYSAMAAAINLGDTNNVGWFAGGGGGQSWGTQGAGGKGGGSAGGSSNNGQANTGGGGGAGAEGYGSGNNGGSGIVIVRYIVGSGAVALAAPSGLTATAVATNQINLAWSDIATTETGYVVNRSLDSTNWTFVTLTAVNATNVSDTGLATNTLYYYRVAASNEAGLSAYCYATGSTWTVYEQWRHLSFDQTCLTNPAISGVTADPDHDGLNNEQEYWAGTNPTNPASCLVLYALTNNPALPGEYVVRWQSVSDRWYTVQAATNLVAGFTNLVTHRPATPPMNVHTDNVGSVEQRFYRVKVE